MKYKENILDKQQIHYPFNTGGGGRGTRTKSKMQSSTTKTVTSLANLHSRTT